MADQFAGFGSQWFGQQVREPFDKLAEPGLERDEGKYDDGGDEDERRDSTYDCPCHFRSGAGAVYYPAKDEKGTASATRKSRVRPS